MTRKEVAYEEITREEMNLRQQEWFSSLNSEERHYLLDKYFPSDKLDRAFKFKFAPFGRPAKSDEVSGYCRLSILPKN